MFKLLYSIGECIGVVLCVLEMVAAVGFAFFTKGIVRTIGHSRERKNNG